MLKRMLIALLLMHIMAACSQGAADAPSRAVQLGDEVINETFDEAGDWTVSDTDGMLRTVADGVYTIELEWRDRYLTGTNEIVHDSAVIEVDVTINETDRLTQAGVICRSSPQGTGDGYYFLISARGEYAIRKGISDSTDQLVSWEDHDAINPAGSVNRVRAVCVSNNLQFFVNDTFIHQITDASHNRGYVGLVVGLPINASGSGTATFDNLQVWEATMP